MENSICKTALWGQAPDQKQGIRRKEQQKDCRKDRRSAFSSPMVNFCRPVGSKFIFSQCEKPYLRPMGMAIRRMLPMVAVRKLWEDGQ